MNNLIKECFTEVKQVFLLYLWDSLVTLELISLIPLVGPPFMDPLAVKILDNRLCMLALWSPYTTKQLGEVLTNIRITLNCLKIIRGCMVCELCILTSFQALAATESCLKYFFSAVFNLLFFHNIYQIVIDESFVKRIRFRFSYWFNRLY